MFVNKRLTGKIALIATVLVLTMLGSFSAYATFDVETQPMENSLEVELNDDFFNPKVINVPKGTTTRIILKNKGVKEHTFTVKELGIDAEVEPGKEKTITVEPKQSGTYELICKYHYQQGMVGQFIVN